MAVKDILVRLKLAATDFKKGLDEGFKDLERQAEDAGVNTSEAMGRGFDKGKAALIGAIGAAGVAAVAAVKQSLDLAQDLTATSKQLGIGVEALQEWRYAASKAGVSASDFDGALGDLRQKIDEAAGGNRKAQQTFVDLGVGFVTTSGHARDTGGVLEDVFQRIDAIKDPTERAKIEMALFGGGLQELRPLLDQSAEAIAANRDEINQFAGVLSHEQIQKLDVTAAKWDELNRAATTGIAKIVADNSDAISMFADELRGLGAELDDTARGFLSFINIMQTAQIGAQDMRDRGASLWTIRQTGLAPLLASGMAIRQSGDHYGYSVSTANDKAELQKWLRRDEDKVEPPRLTAPPPPRTPTRRTGNRPTGPSKEEREAERAAQKALDNYERMEETLRKQIEQQRALAAVEALRAEGQTIMAADAEAQFAFLAKHPEAIHQSVEAYAAALGLNKQQTAELREQLAIQIDQLDQLEEAERLRAREKAFKDRSGAVIDRLQGLGEAARREAEAQAEHFRRVHEQAVMDVADLYEDLFSGGTSAIWRRFKSEGLRIVAEVAGAYTLALLSGNGGGFDLQQAFGASLGRSPLGALFGAAGGFDLLGGGRPANDNGGGRVGAQISSGQAALGNFGTRLFAGGAAQTGGSVPAIGGIGANFGGANPILASIGVANALGGTIESITGLKYNKAGSLIGGVGGALLGTLLGALSSTPRGSAIIGNQGGQLGVTGFYGNSQSRKDQAGSSASSLIDAIYQIADQLGAGVDASKGQVSIGIRNGNYVVDPQGRGYTKTSKFSDLQGFGSDGDAATRAAIADLIRDGVLTGLSSAASNLLNKPGSDLEKQIEKALLIESVPKLLRERLDPLGFALDQLYDKFKLLADAMKEGGASAEQIAEARKLWELEKADAIASIGAASAQLKDYLVSLNAGSNSPLSLRQQRAEAESQLAPYLAQIEAAQAARAEVDRLKAAGADAGAISTAEEAARIAAGKVDQGGFTNASQLLLSISRQANASSGAFFSDFDRIRALTGQAIGLVDGAVPQTSDRDPFAQLTAQNTGDMANMLADHTRLLQAINDNLLMLAPGGAGSAFFTQNRALASA